MLSQKYTLHYLVLWQLVPSLLRGQTRVQLLKLPPERLHLGFNPTGYRRFPTDLGCPAQSSAAPADVTVLWEIDAQVPHMLLKQHDPALELDLLRFGRYTELR